MMIPPPCRRRIRVRGLVQGVGFRPFVFGLATRLDCTGWVVNDEAGVLVEVQGAAADQVADLLQTDAPPLARIEAVEVSEVPAVDGEIAFAIRDTARTGARGPGAAPVTTTIPADAAVCEACLAELFDPADRRYRYPFVNCTHCGPRYTLTRRLPYDRPQTSMASFPLCAACAREYHDPTDRRFHAQPVACPACGPTLSLPIADMLASVRAGRIVAIKGIGGFHCACDAANAAAVERLRRVKQRNGKPFAVMVANLASARRLVVLGDGEAALLASPARPIVLARRLPEDGSRPLAGAIAPDLAWLGVMLPYTPLHYLLFHEAAGRPNGLGWLDQPQDLVLVMTSANPGGEPLVIDNRDAHVRLDGIADLVVDHDREIVIRADDSVVRWIAGAPTLIRRARGYVPVPIRLPRSGPPVLAVGGHLKAAICVTRGDQAFLSQHLGELDTAAAVGFFEETVRHLLHTLDVAPVAVAHDLHPDFHSTVWAARWADAAGVPAIPVQHHHAHLAAVLAEHGVEGPAVGLALDGFGLGSDGTAWGGELLWAHGATVRRLGHLRPLAQPGGDRAAREPWRMAAAALAALGRGAEIDRRFAGVGPAAGVRQMLERGINAAPTSSAGRWFDAACGLLGVRLRAGFEGEAPMVLESLVERPAVLAGGWRVDHDVLDLLPLLDHLCQVNPRTGAELFHGTLAAAAVDWALPVLRRLGLAQVVLAGGCLVNQILAQALMDGFAAAGIAVLAARAAPPNDGGLSLGQAWVALNRLADAGRPQSEPTR